jgi:dipeptidyl aminopeptidase/acylaminoacyl peptidase
VETGDVKQLTDERRDDLDHAWSPDGRQIAFISNRRDERPVDFRSAVWVLPASGGEARRITPDDGVDLSPTWSPDGKEIVYAGLPPGMAPGSNHRLLLVPATGNGTPQSLTEGYEGHIGGALFSDVWSPGKLHPRLRWTPDGERIRCVAACRGVVNVVEVDRTGHVRSLTGGDQACGLLDVSLDGEMLAYAAADSIHPPNLYVKTNAREEERKGGSPNHWLDALPLARPQHLAVTSADGTPIDAWLLTPAGETRPVPGPLVLYIHGGPHSIFGQVFFFDMQLLVANDYRVLFANPRATRGYGDAFATCNVGRWGEGDTPDQMAGLDAALATGWVDPGRIGVMGLSYGGYMTNWLIGHTNRFRAAVSENSISNLASFYGTSDIGTYFTVEEIGAEPLRDPERYARLSPLSAVESITTPLLLLNCLADWRCPVEQGEQLYAALKRLGREVEMVCFPDESHSMLSNGKPRSRLVRRQHILRWFETHLC